MPRLADGVELLGEYEGSGFKEPPYLARRADGQVVRLSRLLYLVALHTDGRRTAEQIAERVSREFGRPVIGENVEFLVEKKLRPLGVLAQADGSSPELPRASPFLALTFRVALVPQRVVSAICAILRPLFLPLVVVAVLLGLAVLDVWLFFAHGLGESVREILFRPEMFLMVLGLAVFSGVFHEFGHAAACRYGGARPSVIGVGIYLVWPVFYSDVTDTYRLGKVGRLRTDLGGVYFNAIFSLVIGAAYFITGVEALLIVILLQQIGMLHQFVPFLRLDGYYVVSDLTGVPDLFGRIKPILKTMVPGRGTDERVEELKLWVRVVVTAWVLMVIPALLCLFAVLLMSAPMIFATAWDSIVLHYGEVRAAFGAGRVTDGAAGLLRMVLLVVPVAGMTLTFALVGKRLGVMIWSWSVRKPTVRAALMACFAAAVAFALFFYARNALLVGSSAVNADVTSLLKVFDDELILRDLGLALLAIVVGGVLGWKLPVERDDFMPIRFSFGVLMLVLVILLVVIDGSPYYRYVGTLNSTTPRSHAAQEGAMSPRATSATDIEFAPGGTEDSRSQ